MGIYLVAMGNLIHWSQLSVKQKPVNNKITHEGRYIRSHEKDITLPAATIYSSKSIQTKYLRLSHVSY